VVYLWDMSSPGQWWLSYCSLSYSSWNLVFVPNWIPGQRRIKAEIFNLMQVVKIPEVKIKWPNDLYAKGIKIGGVLCTSTYSSKNFNVVIGK
jgi:hypothetical protein